MEVNNDYYVYIYWRLDINEPFYIGKGRKNRWKKLDNRNRYFDRMSNKYPIAVTIEKENLTEEQAHGVECWLINELVFEYGYSIDIPKNRSKEKERHLVNMTWGGEGTSGLNSWENTTEENKNVRKEKCSKKLKLLWKNEEYRKKMRSRKGMTGRHHTEETKKKMSENHADFKGENHPMYGKHRSDKTKQLLKEKCQPTDEFKQLLKEKHKDDVGKFVICITTKKIFKSIRKAEKYYNIPHGSIGRCCNKKYKSAGKLKDGTPLIWRFLIWNHNKKFKVNYNPMWR